MNGELTPLEMADMIHEKFLMLNTAIIPWLNTQQGEDHRMALYALVKIGREAEAALNHFHPTTKN